MHNDLLSDEHIFASSCPLVSVCVRTVSIPKTMLHILVGTKQLQMFLMGQHCTDVVYSVLTICKRSATNFLADETFLFRLNYIMLMEVIVCGSIYYIMLH